jgi:hypothetical protein
MRSVNKGLVSAGSMLSGTAWNAARSTRKSIPDTASRKTFKADHFRLTTTRSSVCLQCIDPHRADQWKTVAVGGPKSKSSRRSAEFGSSLKS